jgi:glycosyltransferase involved in cell wall biosynthesis
MSAATPSASQLFIVPDVAGPVTGGTLFNRELVRALAASGTVANTCDLDTAFRVLRDRAHVPELCWLDSLYLDELPRLRRSLGSTHRLGLLLHYLPSLVAQGMRDGDIARADVSAAERAALEEAEAVLVTSAFMRAIAVRLSVPASRVLLVEPGRMAQGVATPSPKNDRLRAVMVANLTPGKGIEPFLGALQGELADDDQFELCIVGSHEMDPAYARACCAVVARSSRLGAVQLPGPLAPEATISRMAESNLMVSASVMEAYGMALAEAKTLGVPILARRGGNVDHMIDGGGELVSNHGELARAFVRLARDRVEGALRVERARSDAWPPRAWGRVADEFSIQVHRVPAPLFSI